MEISLKTPNNIASQEVQVTSFAFRNDPKEKRFESYPKRMVYEGREVSFVDSGIRYLVTKGQQLIKLFDVNDGQNQYRLRLDDNDHWLLVGMKAVA